MSDILAQRSPVNVGFIGGEIVSTGIAFSDYDRMQTFTRKLAPGRRYDIPTWAVNDDQTCAVIARSMEGRAGLRMRVREGTELERLTKAQRILREKEPQLVARLDRLCARFVAAKKEGDEYARYLGIQIEGIDTQLRLLDRTAETLASVVYLYWRCGFNSVEIGEQLGIKASHVRATTYRLIEVGVELGYPAPTPITRRVEHKVPADKQQRAQQLKAARAAAQTLRETQRADIIRLRKKGKFTVDIARDLRLGKDGSEIVNRVLIQAGVR